MKKVLILGGSSDIGIETIKLFLSNNFLVYAHYSKNKKDLKKIKNKNLTLIQSDFKKINNQNINNTLTKKFNQSFDIFINLIGFIDNKGFENTNLKEIQTSLKINALIPVLIQQRIIKKMIAKNYGRILNCSSIGVKFGGGHNSFNYSLSKHCMEFIPNKFKEWSRKNVLVNNLRIGVTNTKIHKKMKKSLNLKKRIRLIPIQRMATSTEISNYIYNLVSQKNSFMTGQTITVSGGE